MVNVNPQSSLTVRLLPVMVILAGMFVFLSLTRDTNSSACWMK